MNALRMFVGSSVLVPSLAAAPFLLIEEGLVKTRLLAASPRYR